MKLNIYLYVVVAIFSFCSIPEYTDASTKDQVLSDAAKLGVSYSRPSEYSNFGVIIDSNPEQNYISISDNTIDGAGIKINVQKIPKDFKIKDINTIKTEQQMSDVVYRYFSVLSVEKISKDDINDIKIEKMGSDKYITAIITPESRKFVIKVAILIKNNHLYGVSFVDSVLQDKLKNILLFDSFMRSFKVKDLSQKTTYVGKTFSINGDVSTVTYTVPEGYEIPVAENQNNDNSVYLQNIRNQYINVHTIDFDKIGTYRWIIQAKNNTELKNLAINYFGNYNQSAIIVDARIKTIRGDKVYVIDFEDGVLGKKSQHAYVFKNGSLYVVTFGDVDTYTDKTTDFFLRSMQIKSLRKKPIITAVNNKLVSSDKKIAKPTITKRISFAGPSTTISYVKPDGFEPIANRTVGNFKTNAYEEIFSLHSGPKSLEFTAINATTFDASSLIFNADSNEALANMVKKQIEDMNSELSIQDEQVRQGALVSTFDKAYITKYNGNTYYIHEYSSKLYGQVSWMPADYMEKTIVARTRTSGYVFTISFNIRGAEAVKKMDTAGLYQLLNSFKAVSE